MPRVGEQLTDELHRISTELGHPGVEALWIAVKKRKLAVSKRQVVEYVRHKSEKQVLGAPQRAAGKSISEDDNRWMMDLVDVSSPGIPAGYWKFFLVVVNVFDRFLYARPLSGKDPPEVAKKLKEILDAASGDNRKRPQIISSDNGSEFQGEVAALLRQKGIVQKFKDAGDLNALGLLDRQIGLLKRKLAEMHSTTKKSWAINLQAAVAALNSTPKPAVLHGDAPAEVKDNPKVTFMLMQDQARDLQHNKKITETKAKAALENTFRPQVGVTKFKRNYQATYGDPKTTAKVENGRVTATTGETYPLKQIKIVPAGSVAVSAATTHARKLRDGGDLILQALQDILRDGEPMALSKAAKELRETDIDYNAKMKKIGGQLIDLIRAEPSKFKLVQRPHGSQTWYFVSLV